MSKNGVNPWFLKELWVRYHPLYDVYECPECEATIYKDIFTNHNYCQRCGERLNEDVPP